MFGIGLPELILILALALIVVGPDKLPDLARSVAKGILDLKKTANSLKESLTEDGNPLDDIKPELEKAAKALQKDFLGDSDNDWKDTDRKKIYDPRDTAEDDPAPIIDVEPEQNTEEPAEKEHAEPGQKVKEEEKKAVDNSKTEEINSKKETTEQLS